MEPFAVRAGRARRSAQGAAINLRRRFRLRSLAEPKFVVKLSGTG